jgi:hypothetical protein
MGSKTGGQQSEKGDEKRAHRGSHHDLTNDPNPCVFRSDGIFGNHRPLIIQQERTDHGPFIQDT